MVNGFTGQLLQLDLDGQGGWVVYGKRCNGVWRSTSMWAVNSKVEIFVGDVTKGHSEVS
jgi:hypothetical protein